MRVVNFVRGRYVGRYVTVTSRRWWSRSERRSAKLACAVVEYTFSDPERHKATTDAVARAVVFGDALLGAEWSPPRTASDATFPNR